MRRFAFAALTILAAPLPALAQEDAGGVDLERQAQQAAQQADRQKAMSVQTRAEALAKAAALYKVLDGDADGFLTRAELDRFAKRQVGSSGKPPAAFQAMVDKMFATNDADKDGRISLAEDSAGAAAAFARSDADNDGRITPDERMAAAARNAPRVATQGE